MTRPKLKKSQEYIDSYEKPKVVEYLMKLDPKLDWDEFAKSMKETSQSERCRKLNALYDNGAIPALRSAFLSQIQASKVHAGKELEDKVTKALKKLRWSFGNQVCVLDNKVIPKRQKGCHVVDFVVPKPKVGDDLSKFTVISTKTTTRERFSQDKHLQCQRLIQITHDGCKNTEASNEDLIVILRDMRTSVDEIALLESELEKLNIDSHTNRC